MSAVIIGFWYHRITKNLLFIIQIKNGKIARLAGNIKSGFIPDFREFVERNRVSSGCVYVIKDVYGNRIIHCSGGIFTIQLQQLRNSWAFY